MKAPNNKETPFPTLRDYIVTAFIVVPAGAFYGYIAAEFDFFKI